MDAETIAPKFWTRDAMERRVVRYRDLKPCYNAFIDTRTPGSEAKENFTIIGPGVSENPEQHVHIAEAHGFNIGGARQPPGCVNSQHSHDTAEVFVVHSGEWRFDLGEHGSDAQVHCNPGDVISLPTGMFRGFTATAPADDGTPGFLWAVLGGDDPGRVLWAPHVFDMAADYGLVLLENGSLIDTRGGQAVPSGECPMMRTTPEQVADLRVASQAVADTLVWRADRALQRTAGDGRGAVAPLSGVTPIIGRGAALDWDHPFALDRFDGVAEQSTGDTPQVLFVHKGALAVSWDGGELTIGAGDTLTVPVNLERSIGGDAIAYRVTRNR
ncbi:MAG: cupin domain-containing protein [Sphingomonadaceae bacterium]